MNTESHLFFIPLFLKILNYLKNYTTVLNELKNMDIDLKED